MQTCGAAPRCQHESTISKVESTCICTQTWMQIQDTLSKSNMYIYLECSGLCEYRHPQTHARHQNTHTHPDSDTRNTYTHIQTQTPETHAHIQTQTPEKHAHIQTQTPETHAHIQTQTPETHTHIWTQTPETHTHTSSFRFRFRFQIPDSREAHNNQRPPEIGARDLPTTCMLRIVSFIAKTIK